MAATTDTVRDQGFSPVACDLAPGLTLSEYRASRPRQRKRRRRLRSWSRRASR